MFQISGQRSERRKWIHQFENAFIIYFVDASSYNEVNTEDWSQNRLMESLDDFDNVVNSRWFTNSHCVILFLSNMHAFRQKLGRYPMSSYFPDYTGGDDISRASKYILERLKSVNRSLEFYSNFCETPDSIAIRVAITAIQDSIILRNISRISPVLEGGG